MLQVPGTGLEVLASPALRVVLRLLLLAAEVVVVGLAVAAADRLQVELDEPRLLVIQRPQPLRRRK